MLYDIKSLLQNKKQRQKMMGAHRFWQIIKENRIVKIRKILYAK